MTDQSRPRLLKGLPQHPISVETVKELGNSDAILGTMPIESRFNDVITEFLLYHDDRIYALAFDPDGETWNVLESRTYDEEDIQEVEEDLMDRLYDWRYAHVIPYLVENDLIPNFLI